MLFKGDLGTFVRAYEFLGQMFDYGNTDFEKLYLFAKMLGPLLEFGRERDGIDLSALRLTHHKMRDLGQQKLNLGGTDVEAEKLAPVTESGSGQVRERHKAALQAIIEALNGIFQGELTDGDRVAFAEGVKTKLLESETLRAQAAANTKEQFSNSPSLQDEFIRAVMDLMAAHQSMSTQTLNSDDVQAGVLSVLLGPGQLWQELRAAPPG